MLKRAVQIVTTCNSTPSLFSSLEIPAFVQLGYLHVGRIVIEDALKIFGSSENLNAMIEKIFRQCSSVDAHAFKNAILQAPTSGLERR